jgi:hypothetical protein
MKNKLCQFEEHSLLFSHSSSFVLVISCPGLWLSWKENFMCSVDSSYTASRVEFYMKIRYSICLCLGVSELYNCFHFRKTLNRGWVLTMTCYKSTFPANWVIRQIELKLKTLSMNIFFFRRMKIITLHAPFMLHHLLPWSTSIHVITNAPFPPLIMHDVTHH